MTILEVVNFLKLLALGKWGSIDIGGQLDSLLELEKFSLSPILLSDASLCFLQLYSSNS